MEMLVFGCRQARRAPRCLYFGASSYRRVTSTLHLRPSRGTRLHVDCQKKYTRDSITTACLKDVWLKGAGLYIFIALFEESVQCTFVCKIRTFVYQIIFSTFTLGI